MRCRAFEPRRALSAIRESLLDCSYGISLVVRLSAAVVSKNAPEGVQ
jgi:hypothetical protein